jgi:hypothetical protein
VLLGTGNGNEGIDLSEPVRDRTRDDANKVRRRDAAPNPLIKYLPVLDGHLQ